MFKPYAILKKVFNLVQWHHVITVKHMMIVFKPQDALQGSSANNYLCISPDLKQKKRGGGKSMLLGGQVLRIPINDFRFDLKF